MTENEWNTTTDLWDMLKHVQPHCGERKLRLLAVACCRVLDSLLIDTEVREALEAAEQYADGRIEDTVLAAWSPRVKAACERLSQYLLDPQFMAYNLVEDTTHVGQDAHTLTGVPGHVTQAVACRSDHFWATPGWEEVQQQAAKQLHPLVTDVIGNPFWPTVLNPAWLTPTVTALATGIYADKAFDRMPILADALEEAGCDNADVLTHCRGSGPHVRGCWVVDQVLGKK
jgi:hypothetical protein